MDFSGKHVLVTYGTRTVGSAVVKMLLTKGAKVTVTTRSEHRFTAFKKTLPADLRDNVFCVETDLITEEDIQKVFDKTTTGDGVQHVVASIGGWWQDAKLADQTLEEFDKGIFDRITGHFYLFEAFVPYLDKQEDSTYTILTGIAGNLNPAPCVSLLDAMNGLCTAALDEYKDSTVAVADFRIHIMVEKKDDSEVAALETETVGNDVVGKAIVKVMADRSRGHFHIYSRQDARDIAK